MKRLFHTLIPALFAIGSTAQTIGSTTVISNTLDPGVVYSTYSICPTDTTITSILPTSTLCPGPYCNGAPTGIAEPGSSITWVTELVNVCPTATNEAGWLTTMTTTMTEACPCMETQPAGYVPSGHTTVVATCTVCGESSPSATIITPIASAAGGASAPAATGAAGAGSGSGAPGSASGSSAPGSGSGSGFGSGAPGSGSGSDSGASAPSATSGAEAAASSSSPQAGIAPAPGSPAGSNGTYGAPMSPSASMGLGSGAGSAISPPISQQTTSSAFCNGIDITGTLFLVLSGIIGFAAWQL